jgi:hypothetical protein
MQHSPHPHWFYYSNNIRKICTNYTVSFNLLFTPSLIGPNTVLSTMFSNTLSLRSSLNVSKWICRSLSLCTQHENSFMMKSSLPPPNLYQHSLSATQRLLIQHIRRRKTNLRWCLLRWQATSSVVFACKVSEIVFVSTIRDSPNECSVL